MVPSSFASLVKLFPKYTLSRLQRPLLVQNESVVQPTPLLLPGPGAPSMQTPAPVVQSPSFPQYRSSRSRLFTRSPWACCGSTQVTTHLSGWSARNTSNVAEVVVLLANGSVISQAEVERFLPAGPATALALKPVTALQPDAAPAVREYRELHSHSAQELRQAMARHGGNQSRAAQSLGMTPRQFGYRWRRLSDAAASA